MRHTPPTAIRVSGNDLVKGAIAGQDGKSGRDYFHSVLNKWIGNLPKFLVPSGRAGLAIILKCLRQHSERRKVVVPAYVCPTVVQSVLHAGLDPVYCDVSPNSLNLDAQAIDKLIDSSILAVVPAHLFGWALDLSRLINAGKQAGFYVVEDAAQAFGAKIAGRMVGTLGDAGVYSLGRGKNIPVGHGGVVVVQEPLAPFIGKQIFEDVIQPRNYDIASLALYLGYAVATHPLGWYFLSRSKWNPAQAGMDITQLPPVSFRGISGVQAQIGATILERLELIQAVSCRNARSLIERLSRFEFAHIPQIAPQAEPVFLRLPVVISDHTRREKIFSQLSQAGIGVSRSYTRTIPDLYKSVPPTLGGDFTGASRLATCLITLPTHAYMREEDMDCITEIFNKFDCMKTDRVLHTLPAQHDRELDYEKGGMHDASQTTR